LLIIQLPIINSDLNNQRPYNY